MKRLAVADAKAPAELLEDARRLLESGDVLPAACMARAALDTHLRGLVDMLGLRARRPVIGEFCDELKRAGAMSCETAREVLQLSDIGNRAAHNYAVDAAEVWHMLAGVWEVMADE